MPQGNLLSIVVPAHNEEANVATLHAALCAVAGNLPVGVEIIFVDDGSTDATRRRVEEIATNDTRVRLVALTRNFGHQAALLAGMEQAKGAAVISIDCDLQHPPRADPRDGRGMAGRSGCRRNDPGRNRRRWLGKAHLLKAVLPLHQRALGYPNHPGRRRFPPA